MSETPRAPHPGPGQAPLPPELNPRGSSRAARAATPTVIASRTSGAKRFGRALSWVAAVTSLLVLLGSGASYLYVNAQFSSIKSIGGLCLKGCKDNPTELGQTENFLLVGTDTRAGANSTGNLSGDGGTAVSGGYGNSDTTLLVHISADTQKVIVVSFPRDMLVTVPTYTGPNGQTLGGYPAKFNAAFSLGGPNLLIKQIEQLTHLPIDHYLSIDFSGFQSMVNALGGVTVCLSVPAYDPGGDGSGGSGFKASAGIHKLNGIQALEYVRQRHGLPGGDLDRIARQQRFLSALIRQAKQPSTLLNPVKLNNFISAITSNVTKDKQTSQSDLLGLVQKLRNLDPSRVEFNTVPTLGGEQTPTLGEYLPIDSTKAHTLFQAIYDDTDPANPPKPKPSPKPTSTVPQSTLTIPPSQITLAVANGSGITGKGSATSALLTAQGYHVSSVTTDTRTDPSTTVISYGSDRADSAKTLAAAIPGAVLTPSTVGPDDLTLIVGTDFPGVNPVTVGTAAAPTVAATTAAPTPTASASKAPVVTAANNNCGP